MALKYIPNKDKGYLEIKMTGEITLKELKEGQPEVIRICNEQKLNKILGDATGVQVHPSPEESMEFMNSLPPDVKYASFTRPGQANMDLKFAEVIGTNNGLKTRVFPNRESAEAWLMEE